MAFSRVTATLSPDLVIKTDIRELLNTIEDQTGSKLIYKKGKYILDSNYETFKKCEKIAEEFLSREEPISSEEDENSGIPNTTSRRNDGHFTGITRADTSDSCSPFSGDNETAKPKDARGRLELPHARAAGQWYAGHMTEPVIEQKNLSGASKHASGDCKKRAQTAEDYGGSSGQHEGNCPLEVTVDPEQYKRLYSDSSDSMPPLERVDDEELEILREREQAADTEENMPYTQNTALLTELPEDTPQQGAVGGKAEKTVRFDLTAEGRKHEGSDKDLEDTDKYTKYTDDMYVDADTWEYITSIFKDDIDDIEDNFGVLCEGLTSGENLEFQHVVVRGNSEVNVKDAAEAVRRFYDNISRDCYKNTYTLPQGVAIHEARVALLKVKSKYPGLVLKENIDGNSFLFIGETEMTRKAVAHFKALLNLNPRSKHTKNQKRMPMWGGETPREPSQGKWKTDHERRSTPNVFMPTLEDGLHLEKDTEETHTAYHEKQRIPKKAVIAENTPGWLPRIEFTNPDEFQKQNIDQSAAEEIPTDKSRPTQQQQDHDTNAITNDFLSAESFKSKNTSSTLERLSFELQSAIQHNEDVLQKRGPLSEISQQNKGVTAVRNNGRPSKTYSRRNQGKSLDDELRHEEGSTDRNTVLEGEEIGDQQFTCDRKETTVGDEVTSKWETTSASDETIPHRRLTTSIPTSNETRSDVIESSGVDDSPYVLGQKPDVFENETRSKETLNDNKKVQDNGENDESDEDIQRAINLSLLDADEGRRDAGCNGEGIYEDDTAMERALQVSLREYEEEQQKSLSLFVASLPDDTSSGRQKSGDITSQIVSGSVKNEITRHQPSVPLYMDFDSDEEYAVSLKRSLKDKKRQQRQKQDQEAKTRAESGPLSSSASDLHDFGLRVDTIPDSRHEQTDGDHPRDRLPTPPHFERKEVESVACDTDTGDMFSLQDCDIKFEFHADDSHLDREDLTCTNRLSGSKLIGCAGGSFEPLKIRDQKELQETYDDNSLSYTSKCRVPITTVKSLGEDEFNPVNDLGTTPKTDRECDVRTVPNDHVASESYQMLPNSSKILLNRDGIQTRASDMPMTSHWHANDLGKNSCDNSEVPPDSAKAMTPSDEDELDDGESSKSTQIRQTGGAESWERNKDIETPLDDNSSQLKEQQKFGKEDFKEKVESTDTKRSFNYYEEHVKKLPFMKNQSFEIKLLYQLLESNDSDPETETMVAKILSDTTKSDPLIEVEGMFAALNVHCKESHVKSGQFVDDHKEVQDVSELQETEKLKCDLEESVRKNEPMFCKNDVEGIEVRSQIEGTTKITKGTDDKSSDTEKRLRNTYTLTHSDRIEHSLSNICNLKTENGPDDRMSNSLPSRRPNTAHLTNGGTNSLPMTTETRQKNSSVDNITDDITKSSTNSAPYSTPNTVQYGLTNGVPKSQRRSIPNLPTIICQPADGSMSTMVDTHYKLPGYQSGGTIMYTFDFKSGRMKNHGPFARQQYLGTYFKTYLPINEEGNAIGQLLTEAFEKGKLFTVAKSEDIQKDNIVVPCIPLISDRRKFPDAAYLDVIKQSLSKLLEKEQ